MTRTVEPFLPQRETVSLYVCGITPYDTTHLGHLFTYASFDILVRYLEYLGHPVRYVQNVTDIDDDILRKSREVGDDWLSLGNRWTSRFVRDMQAANVRPPDAYPRATDVIPIMIPLIETLIEKRLAYESGGSVYFDVEAWPAYGELSHLPREEMLPVANERGNNPNDPRKRRPLDFVLWQAQAPGEPAWDSPWGPGRPGWHIECSTMGMHYLGSTLDIHGGGADLIFPHHESEIAQSEGATGDEPFVHTWMHTAMVRHEGEKMSKSLGNLIMVSDLRQTWSADALRLYLAGHHYREPWSHDPSELDRAERLAEQLRSAVQARGGRGPAYDAEWARVEFAAALDDDLNSPGALTVLERLSGETVAAAGRSENVRAAQDGLRAMASVLGLCPDGGPQPDVLHGWEQHLRRFEQEA
jgi:L-cysteine:1D-myo-inositol 2-amino-2-deoxy-alpha-D-glucopyranoside ligase